MKKFLSVVAVAAFCAASAMADTTIYYDNSASQWDQVHIHYWSSPQTQWPGVALKKVENNIWSYTFEGDAIPQAFLFCNAAGTDQTADYAKAPVANHLYKGSGGKGAVQDLGEYAVDPDMPSLSVSPASGTKFSESLDVTISVTPACSVYYTIDGSSATTSSPLYNGPIHLTESATINVLAVNGDSKATAEYTFTKRNPVPVQNGKNLITDYYKVNPDGLSGTYRTVNMQFNDQKSTTALGNWSPEDLIAQGVARDVCMAFKGKHERPIIDSYAIYASYDEENLYLGVQTVYTVWDQWGEGKQPGESKPYNMDGCLMWAFDLDPAESFDGRINGTGPIWSEGQKGAKFENGVDCIWVGSTKPGVGVPGLFFPTPDGHASYDAAYCKSIPGKYYGYADGLLPSITQIWGQKEFEYDPEDLKGNDGFVDLSKEVAPSAHTFYEWTFPLSTLGITANDIRETGIGVMFIDKYGTSPVGGTPYDPSYFDNVKKSYSQDPSTSMEKEDDDIITYAPARIGKVNSTPTTVETLPAADNDAPAVYYTLQGIRVDNPSKGLYIRVKGDKSTKVIF
ncbi:MAG: chitobiase/beta-hexosaminidase C-terminal domain-containing protein [Muribaculaceae bacterium]|nr:chitobiase/beta-hexosaminidase C-terminal domain-containing protein [Muribaculaceae bacterium]